MATSFGTSKNCNKGSVLPFQQCSTND